MRVCTASGVLLAAVSLGGVGCSGGDEGAAPKSATSAATSIGGSASASTEMGTSGEGTTVGGSGGLTGSGGGTADSSNSAGGSGGGPALECDALGAALPVEVAYPLPQEVTGLQYHPEQERMLISFVTGGSIRVVALDTDGGAAVLLDEAETTIASLDNATVVRPLSTSNGLDVLVSRANQVSFVRKTAEAVDIHEVSWSNLADLSAVGLGASASDRLFAFIQGEEPTVLTAGNLDQLLAQGSDLASTVQAELQKADATRQLPGQAYVQGRGTPAGMWLTAQRMDPQLDCEQLEQEASCAGGIGGGTNPVFRCNWYLDAWYFDATPNLQASPTVTLSGRVDIVPPCAADEPSMGEFHLAAVEPATSNLAVALDHVAYDDAGAPSAIETGLALVAPSGAVLLEQLVTPLSYSSIPGENWVTTRGESVFYCRGSECASADSGGITRFDSTDTPDNTVFTNGTSRYTGRGVLPLSNQIVLFGRGSVDGVDAVLAQSLPCD